MKTTDQRPRLKSGCATTKPCLECVRSTWGEYRLPEQAASSAGVAPPLGAWPLAGRLEFLLELTGQVDEPRRKADVLVDRIALIVARNDLRAALIGHSGFNFVERGVQEIGHHDFDRLPGKQLTQGVQARGIVQIQADRVLLGRAHRCRIFLPTIEQGLEFHDCSAIRDEELSIIEEPWPHTLHP